MELKMLVVVVEINKNQHLYEPDFLLSCNFRISSKCACSIV